MRIIITKETQHFNPGLVRMVQKSHHKMHGKKGFIDPDVIVE
jgi:hypothetical protein